MAVFLGCLPPAVVDLVSNVDVRKRWDTQFPTVEVVEQYSDYCCIYWLVVSSTFFYGEKIVICVWVPNG